MPGLVVVRGRGRGTHLAGHASRGRRYERGGLRADPSRVHRRHLMVSAAAVVVVVGQRGPAGRALHGHQFGRGHGDQTVAACQQTRIMSVVRRISRVNLTLSNIGRDG